MEDRYDKTMIDGVLYYTLKPEYEKGNQEWSKGKANTFAALYFAAIIASLYFLLV